MNMSPIAHSLAAQGREGDTMLVHMAPEEVGGLQSLAQHMGGSLTTNPSTGLPEANFLRSILPTVIGLGASAMFPAAAPWMIGAGMGGGTALLTGDLNKGLMAGLGAFGGAGLGSALGAMGSGAASQVGQMAAMDTAMAGGSAAAQQAAAQSVTGGAAGQLAGRQAFGALPAAQRFSAMGSGVGQAFQQPGAFGSQLMGSLGGPLGAGAAALGTAANFGAFDQPDFVPPTTSEPSSYRGPYLPTERTPRFPGPDRESTAEFDYFGPNSNPVPGFRPFAAGGMASGFQPFVGRGAIEQDYGFSPMPLRHVVEEPVALPSSGATVIPGGIEQTPLEIQIEEQKAAGQDPWQLQAMQGTVFEDAMFGGGQQTPQEVDTSLGFAGVHGYARGGATYRAAGGLASLPSGGEMLEDGSFVVDARTVAELGNGSSNAGIELLMQLGGRPVDGPGDGVSDSIPAMIEGGQPAAVARDEVIFDPEAVARLGEGDHQRGSQRLYELMRMAEDARKEVDRGEPSGAGLEALNMAGAGAV